MTDVDRHGVLELVPTGILLGGALAAARAWLLAQAPPSFRPEDAELLRWSVLHGWPQLLAEALLAGVAGSLLLVAAALRRSHALRWLGLVVAFGACAAYLVGYPSGRGEGLVPGPTSAALGLAGALALVAFVVAHLPFVRGGVATVAAFVIAVVLPTVLARVAAMDAPRMDRRQVIADIVVSADSWRVLEQRADLPPVALTITPIVDLHADTADKPAIRMAPPCAVAFDVPEDAGACVLRAAAGADLTVWNALPPALDALVVDYSVEVDGEVVWQERVAHGRMPLGRWEPGLFAWRHAGGAQGIGVQPGQRVTLRTAFAEDQDLAGLDPAHGLDLGFGGVVLERTWTRARTVARPDAPNIVFVVMDTQRADRLGCYGHPRNVSPNLDALAARGTLFEAAYSTSSWTWPSTASLLTGLVPDEHGVTSNEHCTLPHAHLTLAEVLQARGFTTAAFSGNPLIVPSRQFDQGFEDFDGSVPDFRMSDELVPGAIDWLRRHSAARFFLYLHLVDPHTPHRPHPAEAERLGLGAPPAGWPERGMDGIPAEPAAVNYDVAPGVRAYMDGLYDASVATGDRWLGEVLDELARLGLSDRTVVCFTSDHGEGLLDHGLRGHGNSVFAEEVRVPLVLAGPGVPVGRRIATPVSNRHVAPTLAGFGNADLPLRDPLDLLAPLRRERAETMTRRGLRDRERGLHLHGLRLQDWELVWRERPREGGLLAAEDVPFADLALYDVAADPRQRLDLVEVHEERARELLGVLQSGLRDARANAPGSVAGAGAATLFTLRNIGYVGGDEDGD